MISSSEILDIVEIIYFAPALPFTLWVCAKHGFSREGGWLLLTILCLVRIIGAGTGIAAAKDPSAALIETSLIMSSIGSATLVAALTGIVNRIDTGSGRSPLTPRMRKLIQLIGIAAVALGIYGGTKLGSSDPSTQQSGQTYTKAAVILILLQYLASVAILSLSATNMRSIMDADRTLFFLTSAAVPFVLVRVIYSLCSAFDTNSSTFSLRSDTTTAIIVRAVLAIAMEIIATTLFIIGGFLAPKTQKGERIQPGTAMKGYQQPHEQHLAQETRYQPPIGQPERY